MGLFYVTPQETSRFLGALRQKMAAIESAVVEVYRGMAITAFNYAVQETPQWSGNAAANWNFDIGAPSFRVDSFLKDASYEVPVALFTPGKKGDSLAISASTARAAAGFAALTGLAKTPGAAYALPAVYINNASEEAGGDRYIQMVEENPNSYLRKENEPGHMLARAKAVAGAQVGYLQGPVASKLRATTPGGA